MTIIQEKVPYRRADNLQDNEGFTDRILDMFFFLLGCVSVAWGPMVPNLFTSLIKRRRGWVSFYAGAFITATQPPRRMEVARYLWKWIIGKVKIRMVG